MQKEALSLLGALHCLIEIRLMSKSVFYLLKTGGIRLSDIAAL
jgi:hypothetical protein